MAFQKRGSSKEARLEVINTSTTTTDFNKVSASKDINEIVYCKHCGASTGMRKGNIYYIGDKQLVSLAATNCIKCGKPLK